METHHLPPASAGEITQRDDAWPTLTPDQRSACVGLCIECSAPMAGRKRAKKLGLARHNGHGLCDVCRARQRYAEDRADIADAVTMMCAKTGELIIPDRPAEDLTWQGWAACYGSSREDFYACTERRGAAADEATARALTNCRRCPVREACLGWAVRTGDKFGVLGGTTPAQRRPMIEAHKKLTGQLAGGEGNNENTSERQG